ncbi:MAG: alpha/beta fold hydrolase [Proteobacteria bacterium]|nr:alpha/beta fold hydrolase [Pseudomonadota bacterium]MBU1709153.1 alpha/beta fold hydrolase [Pseudomonadota bacterium]
MKETVQHKFSRTGPENFSGLPVFFIPGWGFTFESVGLAGQENSFYHPEIFVDPTSFVSDLQEFLDSEKIDRIILAGWSMGANLALDFAKVYPERVSKLILLSLRKSWPLQEVEDIKAGLAEDYQVFLRSFYRKCFLGHKDAYRKFQTIHQEKLLAKIDPELLAMGMDYLHKDEVIPVQGVETILLHGKKDIIAPVEQMPGFPGCRTEIVEHCGHPVFLAEQFSKLLSVSPSSKKEKIKAGFSKAAGTYDLYSRVQNDVALQLNTKFQQSSTVKTVLEIGCGTGNYTLMLAEKFPVADITGLDFSEAMIAQARKKCSGKARVKFLCEDGERFLRQTGKKFDFVTSNATMQWFDDTRQAVEGISRILQPGGSFTGSFFGPRSLEEVSKGLSAIMNRDVDLPARKFHGKNELEIFFEPHFQTVSVESEFVRKQYSSFLDLMAHIKMTGTGGWQASAPLVLTRKRLAALDAWFTEQYGGYCMSYEIIYIVARR